MQNFLVPNKMYFNVKKKINITQIRGINSPNERSRCNISDENRRTENAYGRHITCPSDRRARLPHPIFIFCKIKNNEIGWARGSSGGEKFIQVFGGETCKEETTLKT